MSDYSEQPDSYPIDAHGHCYDRVRGRDCGNYYRNDANDDRVRHHDRGKDDQDKGNDDCVRDHGGVDALHYYCRGCYRDQENKDDRDDDRGLDDPDDDRGKDDPDDENDDHVRGHGGVDFLHHYHRNRGADRDHDQENHDLDRDCANDRGKASDHGGDAVVVWECCEESLA